MTDIDKARIQRDAKRIAARRTTASSGAGDAIIRHLGVELYKERRRAEHPPDKPDGHEDSGNESKGSPER